MEKNNMIIIAVALIAVVAIAAVAGFYILSDNGEEDPVCMVSVSDLSDTSVENGTGVVFSVTAVASEGGVKYQWQSSTDGSNWTDINGATLASYSLTATTTDNDKQFRCVVTSIKATDVSVKTSAATLSVYSVYSFLFDDGGVFVWQDGIGVTPLLALKDACEKAGIDINIGNDGWVSTINGKGTETVDDGGTPDDWNDDVYAYWLLYTWDASTDDWVWESTTINGIDLSIKYICYLYGESAMSGATDVPSTGPIDFKLLIQGKNIFAWAEGPTYGCTDVIDAIKHAVANSGMLYENETVGVSGISINGLSSGTLYAWDGSNWVAASNVSMDEAGSIYAITFDGEAPAHNP